MKPIGHVLLYTDDTENGGVSQYNHTVLCALAARGHTVTSVQSPADNPLVRQQSEAGVRHRWLGYHTGREFARTLKDTEDARFIFEQERPDLVLFSNSCPISNFAAKRAALSLGLSMIIVENFANAALADRFPGLLGELGRHYAAARAVICVSHENHALLCRYFHLPVAKGQVIYNGRPDRFFRPADPETRRRLRAEIGAGPDAVLCFTAARLDTVKGFDVQLTAIDLLRATAVWPKLVFAWAGTGKQMNHLAAAVGQRQIERQVHSLGQRWDVDEWLDAADIFVLPSLCEGMPLAIMEAMAKGLPVAASAVSGIPEQLGPTGRLLPEPWLNPQGAAAALAETITTWAEDHELRRQVGDACRERALVLFREERMQQQTLAVVDRALLPAGDYVSPGLEIVRPDACFPQMMVADPRRHPWQYLRRHVPHRWCVDRRWPLIGWLSRDEASLLYNNARQFAGKPALEMNCFCGWSTCHLALAGVEVDAIDPLLAVPELSEGVRSSLRAAGVNERVRLYAGETAAMIQELAQRCWSLFLIDDDRDSTAARGDAELCARHAAADAMILIHDLACPKVALGLNYLRDRGWQTMVYQTMQIMGIAWRGNVQPVPHRSDPSVAWHIPEHLSGFRVSGCSEPVIARLPK
jgi:glycosyltransferase involved in cell wall biosynthesis/predicted O-methyltransferase YrrM